MAAGSPQAEFLTAGAVQPAMGMATEYAATEPSREEVDKLPGATVIEFGSPSCGYCNAAQRHIAAAFSSHPGVRHIKVADASGRRLGRSFRVKLWPTLVFLRDGSELARLVRPGDSAPIRDALVKVETG
ncbi:MAG TPA: thioredoxin family protein [Usitatibacter sp.]|nr:thioredoxin family protein [Usitatibacter sp.]